MTRRNSLRLRPKFLEVLRYKTLYRLFAHKFLLEHNLFEGKSVLLAGPARTLHEDLKGFTPSDFDIIIKMNNGISLPLPFGTGPSLRCDVLFHSLTCDIPPVTNQALDTAKVGCLVHRSSGKGRFPLTLKAARDFGTTARKIRFVAPNRYRALSQSLGGASPTTGLVCLDFLLNSEPSKIVVAGFTFFQTKYQPGYDDRDKSDHDSIVRVKSLAHHDPEKERALTQAKVEDARRAGITIVLGPKVEAALSNA